MSKVKIKYTENPTVIKFEFEDFIIPAGHHHFENIDQAKNSPLAKQLFYLPFVKTVYLSGNFLAIERYQIVEWPDVAEEVAAQIENFLSGGGKIIEEPTATSKKAVTIYAEMTPNPATMKFVANFLLTKSSVTFTNIDQTASSALARALFEMPYVKELYFTENYVSITKYELYSWDNITMEIRLFIKAFFENGGLAIDDTQLELVPSTTISDASFDALDETSQKIVSILDEYVKPAVAADGGNIAFDSFDEAQKRVKVILQGACNGCPSSTFTLKSGIENMLKDMLKDDQITVEAING
jgi:Fe-S cluster biogenesis protein NfuA